MSLHIFTHLANRNPWMIPLGSNVREAESSRSVTYILLHWSGDISEILAILLGSLVILLLSSQHD
jgi:hypothetical protein